MSNGVKACVQGVRVNEQSNWTRFKLYNHDPAGNVASITDINSTLLSYAYDATGRLTAASNTATGSFGTQG